jgi:hypothetical protein
MSLSFYIAPLAMKAQNANGGAAKFQLSDWG